MDVDSILVQGVLQRQPFETVVYVPVEHPDAPDSGAVRHSDATHLGNDRNDE